MEMASKRYMQLPIQLPPQQRKKKIGAKKPTALQAFTERKMLTCK